VNDQFQFEPEGEPDEAAETGSEGLPTDPRVEESLDEGYAPAVPWSQSPDSDDEVAEVPGEQFEQRLEQEQPDVEDDWDEDLAVEGGPLS